MFHIFPDVPFHDLDVAMHGINIIVDILNFQTRNPGKFGDKNNQFFSINTTYFIYLENK